MDNQTIFAALRDALVELYPNEGDAQVINAQGSQGFVNHPSGPVTQNFGPVTYDAPKPRVPLQRPPRAAHFQDRQAALTQLLADLQPGQVVTLCGPGGIGKSALAAEAVWQLAPGSAPPSRFPDGIIFYSFYNQQQVALALEHIARSFGEEIKPTPKAAAQRALAGRCVLLLLDGTEQADDLGLVVDIRDRCGVLVTSRQRKDQVDKRQDVAPLPIADAVALLQAWSGERAAPTSTFQRISELVGRLPLALRLVGRYLNETEENAANYLTWLETTPLTALDQGKRSEQSVPLLLTRSLAQVSATARQVVDVVGLLALAPFDRETIAVALELSTPVVMQALGELVNYGLLLRPVESYEVTHALIHTYARSQLTSTTDSKVIERLAAHYMAVVDAHPDDFSRLNQLRPHVLMLLRIGSERTAWTTVSALVKAIDKYLDLQGYWTERITTLHAGLAAAQALQNEQDEGNQLGRLGITYANLGHVEQAITYYAQALNVHKAIGYREREGVWLGNLGSAYRVLGQVEQAITYYEQALAIAQELGDRRREDVWLGNLGIVYDSLGQVEQAITYYEQALAIAQTIGDRRNEGNHLCNLGVVYHSLGQVEQAITYYEQALAIAKELGDRKAEGIELGNLGIIYADLGQVEQAITYYKQALAIAQTIGYREDEGNQLSNLGNLYYSLAQFEQAISYSQQALAIAKETGNPKVEGDALSNLGEVYRQLKQYQTSIDYLEQALVIVRKIRWRFREGEVLKSLGSTYQALGQAEQAKLHWGEALQIFAEMKSPYAKTVREWLEALQEE